jgi:hypothetical protein
MVRAAVADPLSQQVMDMKNARDSRRRSSLLGRLGARAGRVDRGATRVVARHRLRATVGAILLSTAIAACGGGSGGGSGSDPIDPSSDRSGGRSGRGGSGGGVGTGGAAGSSTPGTGGSSSDAGPSGSGGTSTVPVAGVDASASADVPASTEGGTSGDADAGAAGGAAGQSDGGATTGGALPAGALGWYEAEAVPPNTLFGGTKIAMCGTAPPCTSLDAIKEGVECCSGGKKLSQLLRGRGGVVVNDIAVPADGMYDVTWWYHCGKNDNFGDPNCGGLPHTPSGCRPHIMEINGTKLGKVSEWPCFPGSWGQIHAVTTPIAFKAGKNSIRIYATPGRDAADLDALAVYPAGMGQKPIAGTH